VINLVPVQCGCF